MKTIKFSINEQRCIIDGWKNEFRRLCDSIIVQNRSNYPKWRIQFDEKHQMWLFQGAINGITFKKSYREEFVIDCPYKLGEELGDILEENKQLKEDINILAEILKKAEEHLDFCGYGDSYERECAFEDKLPEAIGDALKLMEKYNENT